MDTEIFLSMETWMIILIFLFAIYFIVIITRNKTTEGFVNSDEEKDTPSSIYDDFYSSIYDSLVYNHHRNEFELNTAMDVLQELPKKQNIKILQAGCGSGMLLKGISKKLFEDGIKATLVGADISSSMISQAKKYPENPDIKFIQADISSVDIFTPNTYDAVFCLYFTFYYLNPQQQASFFQNVQRCLTKGGKFVLHTVNKHKFDSLLPAANPISILNPQQYSKERITQSKVTFADGMSYVGTFLQNNNNDNEPSVFQEIFKSGKAKRTNNHKLYFTTEKTIIQMASHVGLTLTNKIDMVTCSYQYQYLLIFTK